MKKGYCVLFILIGLLISFCSVSAEESQAQELLNNTDFSEIEGFLQENEMDMEFKEMIYSFINGQDFNFQTITEYLKEVFFGEIESCLSMVLKIIAIGIISAFMKELKTDVFTKSVGDCVFLVSYLLIAFILSAIFIEAVNCAKLVIKDINEFISMCMPLLMTFLAGCGAAKTAACVNPIILIGIELLSVFTSVFFLPMIFSFCMLSIFSGVSTNIDVSAFGKAIKTILKWSMGLVFSIFAGIVSIYAGFVSTSDALSSRAAKYVVGSAVPVVGPLISETMGAFTYSCAIVKNAFGTVVICIIIGLAAIPIIKLFVIMFMINISSALISPFTDKKISGAVCETGSAVSYILGLVCLTAVLFIICVAVILHTSDNVII